VPAKSVQSALAIRQPYFSTPADDKKQLRGVVTFLFMDIPFLKATVFWNMIACIFTDTQQGTGVLP
jgi:hypothetical protein